MSARCSVAIGPGSRRVRSRTRMPDSGFARKLFDRLGKGAPQYPVLDCADRFGFLAVVAVRRKRFAILGLLRLAAAHRDQRICPAEVFGGAVGAHPAGILSVVDKQERRLDRAEIEAGQAYAPPAAE